MAAVEELFETGICEEHVHCACHTLQLSIKNYIDPAKPKNAPAAPINPTSDLVSTFRKLVNKIHASPLLTENLHTAQIGGPAAELIMEEADEDNSDDTQQATRQVIEGGGNTAVNSVGFHRSSRGHTLKLIQDVVTRWNSTYYMLERCIHLQIPLCKLIDELGLEGPSEADWSAAKMLCQFLKPFQIVTDYLQGEKYPTLGSLSRKIAQLMLYLSRPNPPHSWGASCPHIELVVFKCIVSSYRIGLFYASSYPHRFILYIICACIITGVILFMLCSTPAEKPCLYSCSK